MTAEGCRQWRESLGVYALGALEGPERAALEAHLEGCEECRDEASSLAGVARVLPLADPARLGAAPEPPAALGRRISAGIAAERRSARRRRRFRVGFGLAAAAAAAAAIAAIVFPGGGAEPAERVEFASLPPGMRITAALEPRPFGTQIRMQVSGVRSGTLCRVYLRRSGGGRVAAGSFVYRYGGDSEATMSSGLDLSSTEAVVVKAGDRTFMAPIAGQPAGAATESDEYEKEKA
jgi:hypothetical protein